MRAGLLRLARKEAYGGNSNPAQHLLMARSSLAELGQQETWRRVAPCRVWLGRRGIGVETLVRR